MRWERDGADWPNREFSRFVDCRPHRWHVQRAGAGRKVLLVHGAGGATHSWRDVLPNLAADHDVMALDLPGQGFTRLGARRRCGLDEMAADIAALLTQEDFAPDILVGHSAGAAIALRMALSGATRPALAIGFNPALSNFPGLAGWLFPTMAKLLSLNPLTALVFSRTATPGAVRRLIEGTGSRIDARGLDLYARLLRDYRHVDGALEMMASWSLDRLLADLPGLSTPVRFVVGAGDRAVSPDAAFTALGALPDCQVTTWPGLGHLAHEEAPQMASEYVRNAKLEIDTR